MDGIGKSVDPSGSMTTVPPMLVRRVPRCCSDTVWDCRQTSEVLRQQFVHVDKLSSLVPPVPFVLVSIATKFMLLSFVGQYEYPINYGILSSVTILKAHKEDRMTNLGGQVLSFRGSKACVGSSYNICAPSSLFIDFKIFGPNVLNCYIVDLRFLLHSLYTSLLAHAALNLCTAGLNGGLICERLVGNGILLEIANHFPIAFNRLVSIITTSKRLAT